MAAPKSKSGVRSGAAGRVRMAGKSALATTTFFVGSGQTLPKGAAGFKLKVPGDGARGPHQQPEADEGAPARLW